MLDMPRLTVARQRRVALSLRELSRDKAALKPLHADAREALSAAVAVGERLDPGYELPPLVLDNTTDSVIGALEDLVEAVERGMNDRVVKPLTEAQARKKAAATTLREKAFPSGSGFLQVSMPQQYRAMRALADTLERDRETVAAVRELGLGWFVEHVVAHLAPYGRAVKSADDRDLEAESDAFHEAYVRLAVLTSAHHAKDAAVQKHVLGAYETELAAQRDDEREGRKRAAARKKSGATG